LRLAAANEPENGGGHRLLREVAMKKIVNLGFMTVCDGISKLAAFIAIPYLAVKLQPTAFGVLGIVTAVYSFLIVFSQFGTGELGILRISPNRDKENVKETINEVLTLRLMLVGVLVIFSVISMFVSPFAREHALYFIWGFLSFISLSLSLDWVLQGLEKFWISSLVKIFSRLLYVSLILTMIHSRQDLLKAIFIQGVCDFIALAALLLVLRKMEVFHFRPVLKRIRALAGESGSLFVMNAAVVVMITADILLLSLLKGARITGLYSAVLKLMIIFQSLRGILGPFFLPQVARMIGTSRESMTFFLRRTYFFIAAAAALLACVGFLYAREIVDLIFGPVYKDAAPVLSLIIWSEFFSILSFLFTHVVVTIDRKLYAKVIVAIALENLCLNFLFIKMLGMKGAALANVISAFTLFAASSFISRKHGITLRFKVDLLLPLAIAAGAFGFSYWFLRGISFWLALLAGGALFVLALAAARLMSRRFLMGDRS
jgi:PST family polysaccharide transporter